MRIVLFLPFLCFFVYSAATPQSFSPKRETRAVWLTTAAGLDWPHSLDRAEQQASLAQIVEQLHTAHFNTIFFQARARGDAYYKSAHEPWAENLTGVLGKDPGWDPLAFLIERAHGAGLEVHAWFNVFKVRGSSLPITSLQHPSRPSARWIVHYAGEAWIDPGIPEARNYLLDVVVDLVKNYDLDGVNFDYIRYPGRDFPDDASFRRNGNGTDRDEWRRANVTNFVTEAYNRITAVKPAVKVGSSPLGTIAQAYSPGSVLRTWYQDAPAWLMKGKQDYVSPQIYWNIGESRGDPDFAELARSWQALSAGRHVYPGIAAYKPDVAREMADEVDSSRAAGTQGEAFFRYEHIARSSLPALRYGAPALVPSMPWKDDVPPLSPGSLAVSEIRTDIFQLEWVAPGPAADGDLPAKYAIYRATSPAVDVTTSVSLVAVIAASGNYYIDTIKVPSGVSYYYAVTAVDRGNNESAPSRVSGATLREVIAMKHKVPLANSLAIALSSDGRTPALAAYKLAAKTAVRLDVYRSAGQGKEDLLATLVQTVQDVGTYVVGMRELHLAPGRYVVRLDAGGSLIEETITSTSPRQE